MSGGAPPVLTVPIELNFLVLNGACWDSGIDFFSHDRIENRKAMTICGACPVESECLQYAMAMHEKYGIWGGKTPPMRNKYRTKTNNEARVAAK